MSNDEINLKVIRDHTENNLEVLPMDVDLQDKRYLLEYIDKIEVQNAIMRKALQAVEWVRISTWDINGSQTWLTCAWDCGGTPKKGHASDCPRQLGLGIEVHR